MNNQIADNLFICEDVFYSQISVTKMCEYKRAGLYTFGKLKMKERKKDLLPNDIFLFINAAFSTVFQESLNKTSTS